jgi:uncharacterized protein (TIGR03067 family)
MSTLLVVHLLLLAGQAAPDEIDGEWEGVGAPTSNVLDGKLRDRWVVKAGLIIATSPRRPTIKSEWKYRLDPSTSPKQIDLMPQSGPNNGKTLKGIYKVEGDELTICHVLGRSKDFNQVQRPQAFDVKGNEAFVMLTFKRKSGSGPAPKP